MARALAGAWIIVAVLPHYNIQAAKRAGRAALSGERASGCGLRPSKGHAAYRDYVDTLCILCIPCTLFHLVCSKFGRCARGAQSSFEIRAKCAEFAEGVLIPKE